MDLETGRPANAESPEEDKELRELRCRMVSVAFPVNLCFVFMSYSTVTNQDHEGSGAVVAHLDALRFYFHSMIYIGIFTSYVRTRGAFYHALLLFFYANGIVCILYLAWRSPCLLNTLYLVALSVAGTMHVFAEPILLRYAGEEPMQIRTSGFRRVQLEWLMVFERFQLLEVLYAFGHAVENYREGIEPGLVLNNAAHESVLPAFGYFCWKCMVQKSETTKGAALFYLLLLMLTMPQRLVQAIVARSLASLAGFLLNCCQLFAFCAVLVCGGEVSKFSLAEAFQGSLVRLPITNAVNLGDNHRPTWYFDNNTSMFPRLRFQRWSVSIHAVSTFVFCMSWVFLGFLAVPKNASASDSKITEVVYAMNAAAHGLVVLGFLYFSLSDYFGADMPRLNMSGLANVGFFILNCLSIWKTSNKLVYVVSVVQLASTGLNLCLLVYIVCVPYTRVDLTQTKDYEVVQTDISSRAEDLRSRPLDSTLRVRQSLLVVTLLLIIGFVLLAVFVLIGNDGTFKHARVDVVHELVFHFGFLLPVLSWTGMLVNHRLNLAFASCGSLYVAGMSMLSVYELFTHQHALLCVSLSLIAVLCIIFSVLNMRLRRMLVRANAPQGHVVWGRR